MPTSFLHYKIIEKLGEGGMGVVYLARDTKLKRRVALKFLPGRTSRDSGEHLRFRQEAQAAAALNHQNIAQVHAIEEIDDELFIVMEYVEGKELRQAIEEGNLSMEEKVGLTRQIASGIKAAHDKGVVHRDIKSANIMIDSNGRVKIMDFGLARVPDGSNLTKAGTTIGTTAYMSPEQLSGSEVDARSDIWSFGVVLYELFTGELPFQGVYEPAIMYAITEEIPVPVTQLNTAVPERIGHVVRRCLEKDVGRRYSDFSEVLEDLEEGKPVHQTGGGTSVRSVLGDKASSYLYGAIGIFALLILILFFTMSRSGQGSAVPEKRYLAVLPIDNIGNNPEIQAICDGLAETMSFRLSELEKYEDSYWVAPASEMRKENIRSATQANRLFGVNLAVLSTIQTFQDSTRLILELVDADNVHRLGTERVVVASNDLAALERNGVRAMLRMMHIEINPRINETLGEGGPSEPQAYEFYLKGRASLQDYASQESLDQALAFFEESVEIDPDFSLGYAGLGETYWRKYETTGDVTFVQHAKTSLNRAVQLNERLAPVQELLGILSAGTGEHNNAVRYFSQALEIDPRYTPAYRGLARVYDELGDAEKAVSTYMKAIELKPDYWEGHKDLGIHYLRKGAFPLAIDQFRKVVEITPKNSTAYSNLGVAYYYSGQNEMARQMFENSLALEKNPLTANNLAGIYFWEGMYKESAAMYELALEAFSNRYEIWGNLAAAYDWSGQPEKSRKSYLTAIEKAHEQLEINPNNAQVLADLGAYYSDVEDTVNALRYITRAIDQNIENIMVRHRAVTTYEQLGMRAEALRWIDASMISDIESQPEFEALIADPNYLKLKKELIEVAGK